MHASPPALPFSLVLERNQFEFVEEGPWLHVGAPDFDHKWIVFVSAKSLECQLLLDVLIPLLSSHSLPFRLIKDEVCNYSLNSGHFGISEVGKFVSIYTRTEVEALLLGKQLSYITESFHGPTVPDTIRIGKAVYAALSEVSKREENGKVTFKLTIPQDKKEIPFAIERKYRKPARQPRVWGTYYIPTALVRPAPKGDIYKATSIKDLSLSDVLLKEGRSWALEDWQNRDIKSRMRWQMQVIRDLQDSIPTPRVIDCFDKGEDCVMVMDYIEGTFLPQRLDELRGKTLWKDIPDPTRVMILSFYLQIINIVRKVHDNGYVHRDLQDNNFIICSPGRVFIVDFELAYASGKRIPIPPFPLGTFGYISPEQISGLIPSREADVYSLGSLLFFMVTMTHPQAFLRQAETENALGILSRHIDPSGDILEEMIVRCMDTDPGKRPGLRELYQVIYEHASCLLMEPEPMLEESLSPA
jgi:serine/threonine protein kinase